jgi:hypothetical protein
MEHIVTNINPKCAESPAEKVMRVFGSARASALAGLTTEALRKWNRRLSKGGQGGLVPARYQQIFLQAAQDEGLPLSAEDFIAEPRA